MMPLKAVYSEVCTVHDFSGPSTFPNTLFGLVFLATSVKVLIKSLVQCSSALSSSYEISLEEGCGADTA